MASEKAPVATIPKFVSAVERVYDETPDAELDTLLDEEHIKRTINRIIIASEHSMTTSADRYHAHRDACFHLGAFAQWHAID